MIETKINYSNINLKYTKDERKKYIYFKDFFLIS